MPSQILPFQDRIHVKFSQLLCQRETGTLSFRDRPAEAIQERRQDHVDFDAQLELRQCAHQGLQGGQVELVWEALDEALHEVLLGDVVLACNHLLQDPRLHNLLQQRS